MCSTQKTTRLMVRQVRPGLSPSEARLHFGSLVIRATIGKNGVSRSKREGDGKTPIGGFKLKPGFYRGDRLLRLCCRPGLNLLRSKMGWGDEPWTRVYNRPVPVDERSGHELLWREDQAYDLIFPTSHNEIPRVQGKGSAIFFHMARSDYAGTEGCVAISAADMRRLLPRLSKQTRLIISA